MSTTTPIIVTPILILMAILLGQHDPAATHMDERPPNLWVADPEQPSPMFHPPRLTGPASEDLPPTDHFVGVNKMVSEPTLTPVVAAYHAPLDEAAMRAVASAAGFTGQGLEDALRVAWCESRWNPASVGGAGELGLWQIHPVHHDYLRATFGPDVDIADPAINAWYAYRLSAGGTDWSHWSCKP